LNFSFDAIVDERINDSLLSKQRNKILERFADHILKESCQHCQQIARQALIIEDEDRKTHCKKCGEWFEGSDMCPECGMINK